MIDPSEHIKVLMKGTGVVICKQNGEPFMKCDLGNPLKSIRYFKKVVDEMIREKTLKENEKHV